MKWVTEIDRSNPYCPKEVGHFEPENEWEERHMLWIKEPYSLGAGGCQECAEEIADILMECSRRHQTGAKQ